MIIPRIKFKGTIQNITSVFGGYQFDIIKSNGMYECCFIVTDLLVKFPNIKIGSITNIIGYYDINLFDYKIFNITNLKDK